MATITSTTPTLLDLAKRLDPNGKVDRIVEILNQQNEILLDMSWIEGNLTTGHRTTVRTGLPTPTWRKLNGGIQPTKSRTGQITCSTGMLEDMAEVDKAMADLNGNTAEFRLSEDRAHLEGMNQELSETLFFGNEATESEAFTGLAAHYNSLSAESGDNIIDAGGTGADNASIWLVVWSEDTIFGIVPKGSRAGWQMNDMGVQVIENADGAQGRMVAYRTHYRWDAGLCVKDWRFAVRIANIDKSDLSTVYTAGAFATGAHLAERMFEAMELIPRLGVGRPVFYMSRDIRTKVRQQLAAATQQSVLATENVGGILTTTFHGIPLRRVDELAANEAQVT